MKNNTPILAILSITWILQSCNDSTSTQDTPRVLNVSIPNIIPNGGIFTDSVAFALTQNESNTTSQYSLDSGKNWINYLNPVTIGATIKILIRGNVSNSFSEIDSAYFVYPKYGKNLVYDFQTYKTVEIGNLLWMAGNLNYASGGACYNNDLNMCDKYGRLYTWAEALALPEFCNYTDTNNAECKFTIPRKGICPNGWRIPTENDWLALSNIAKKSSNLKAANSWYASTERGYPTFDLYGFSALAAGLISHEVSQRNSANGEWWGSYEYSAYDGAGMEISNGSEYISIGRLNGKSVYRSVRCVSDL